MESHKNEENIDTTKKYSWVKYLMYIIAIAGFVIAIVAIVKAYDDVSIINGTDVKTVFSRTGDIIAVNGDYSADQVTNAVDQSSLNSKGDLFAATSKEKVGVLTTGADGFVLTSDSSKPTGLKWGEVDIFNKAILNPLFRYISSANFIVHEPPKVNSATTITYSTKSKIAITSGQPNTPESVSAKPYISVDGVTWTENDEFLFDYTLIEYSPSLDLFSAIEPDGIQVSTSKDCKTWSVEANMTIKFYRPVLTETAGTVVGNSERLKWFSEFGKFFTGSQDGEKRIYTSTDGKVYNLIKSDRIAIDFATNGSIIVAVGDEGPQYSEDGGDSWMNSETSTGMGCVAYSPTTGLFVSGATGEGSENEIWHSTDGKTWTLSGGTTIISAIRAIMWVQTLQIFVLGSESGMWISNDGFSFVNVYIESFKKSISGIQYIEDWGMLFGISQNFDLVQTPKLFSTTSSE
jgi:hypothetical protein